MRNALRSTPARNASISRAPGCVVSCKGSFLSRAKSAASRDSVTKALTTMYWLRERGEALPWLNAPRASRLTPLAAIENWLQIIHLHDLFGPAWTAAGERHGTRMLTC